MILRPRGGVAGGVSGWVTKRARLVVGIWVVVLLLLAAKGSGIDGELEIHPLFVDGTGSKRAHEIAEREFGGNYTMVVMLRGPRASVEQQGQRLASRLGAIPRIQVISPWARGATIEGLRPEPRTAALIVRIEGQGEDEGLHLLAPVRRQVARTVAAPVEASMAGFPVVIDSFRTAIEDAARVGLLISMPVLLVVLLFVFRSLLAAAMPLVIGGAVVAASRGVLSLLGGVFELDLFALSIVAMLGLALGVDYSLLVVSRFREEYRGDPVAAARTTAAATSRSVLPAGCALIAAMGVPVLLLPGSIASSVSLAVITAALLSMLSALFVAPALLALLGNRLDRWSLPPRRAAQGGRAGWSRRLASRPAAVISILFALVLLSGWALTLESNIASAELLPPGDPGRQQQEAVEDGLGPGWTAPMEVVVDGGNRPVTTARRLREIASFQRRLERDPGVESLAGLAQIERGARQLTGIEDELAAGERGLERLETGLGRLRNGAALNTGGLLQAAEGSAALRSGVDQADAGAEALAGGLQEASSGSARLGEGLGKADEGSGKLAQGTARASSGAGKLADALGRAREQTGDLIGSATLIKAAMRTGEERIAALYGPLQGSEEQLALALGALQRMSVGRTDPEYAAALRAVEEANRRLTGAGPESGEPESVEDGLERADSQFGVGAYLAARLEKEGRRADKGFAKLAEGANQLDRGLQRLEDGSRRVAGGIARLAEGGEALSPAMRRLGDGAELLTGGLGQLGEGAGGLATGLAEGAKKSKALGGGIERIETGLQRKDDGGPDLTQLRRRSPGLFRSAYFVLAGLDGAQPAQRNRIGFLVNIDRGGSVARMLVIPRDAATSSAAAATVERLQGAGDELGRSTATDVAVGGVGPAQMDANEALRAETLPMRLLLSLVSFLILIPVTRSLVLPFFAALINLIAVSASLGILSLLFNDALLGGPGYVDATVIPSIVIVMFGLAIDYEVFVFARIREEYERSGSTREAVDAGLAHIGHVVSGAATIMIAVFLASSVTEFITIRNFGVAQAIAVFIDAFAIRLVVVPALMIWLGRWCWWIPAWLSRMWPERSVARQA
jgi:RND superfamily putative drug exporter